MTNWKFEQTNNAMALALVFVLAHEHSAITKRMKESWRQRRGKKNKKWKQKEERKTHKETINEQNVKVQCVPYVNFTFHFCRICCSAVPLFQRSLWNGVDVKCWFLPQTLLVRCKVCTNAKKRWFFPLLTSTNKSSASIRGSPSQNLTISLVIPGISSYSKREKRFSIYYFFLKDNHKLYSIKGERNLKFELLEKLSCKGASNTFEIAQDVNLSIFHELPP